MMGSGVGLGAGIMDGEVDVISAPVYNSFSGAENVEDFTLG